ncbi:nodulation protein NfeD [Legionella sp. 27fs60]|uniref:Nodulation protein NfeD n=2 Tax=Legionella bononiensis TaxID=2793102 RepID=A0ABS1WFP9_9GAMM|nr:nodulation protein NfeD [Legionella bononiensis]MBL7528176.1 nodulation protein NfeD [Legionella bononiensis]
MRKTCTMHRDIVSSDPIEVASVRMICSIMMFLLLIVIGTTKANAAKIIELNIQGPIGPATVDYIDRGINSGQNADLILVIIDTPGGLDDATRLIIQKFLNSKIPIVTYVSPIGARAASAGTYLLYASTVAAMAPGTQLGAASPISLNSGISPDSNVNQSTTMNKKMTNDAVATIRALAQLRGRDPDFAQNAVINATTLTAIEAHKSGAINYIATDKYNLLAQLNGITVVQNNHKMTLNTDNPQIERINPDWRTRFLSVITNPTVAYLLILLGIYGIFFELLNPGFVLPGVVGAVSMLLALYALQLLPVNYAGLLLIVLGMAFLIAEAFTPSFGVLGVGGTIAFVLGSIMLMNTDYAAFQIAWSTIWAMAFLNVLIFIVLLGMIIKSRRQKVRNGLIMLVGAKGRALGDINPDGQAVIRGEIWSVRAKAPIAANKNIKVILINGLLLEVVEDLTAE